MASQAGKDPAVRLRGQPGYVLQCSSFKSDASMAALLGYSDVALFRRFRFSPAVLQAFNLWKEICHSADPKKAIIILHDAITAGTNINEVLPVTHQAILQRYPITDVPTSVIRRNRDSRLAALLYKMVRDIDNDRQSGAPALDTMLSTEVVTLQTEHRLSPPVPALDATLIVWPQLGPRPEFNEANTAPYERAFYVLKSLQAIVGAAKWRDTFGSKTGEPFKPRPVPAKAVPVCMQATQTLSALTMSAAPGPAQAEHTYIAEWEPVPDSTYGQQLAEHLNSPQFKDKTMPGQQPVNSPVAFSDERAWRDMLRRVLKFESLAVDFVSIVLVGDGDTSFRLYAMEDNSQSILWPTLGRKVGDLAQQTFRIVYRCYPLEPEEIRDGYAYEYHGPPVGIEGDVAVQNNDIVEVDTQPQPANLTQPATVDNNDGSGDDERAGPANDGPAPASTGAHAIAALEDLVLNEHHSFGSSTPQGLFEGKEKAELLAYYGGHDAETDKGLRDWQIETITSVTMNVPTKLKSRDFLSAGLDTDLRASADASRRQLERENFAADVDVPFDIHAYQRIQGAFVGSVDQTGPPVGPSAELLGMQIVGWHDKDRIISRYSSTLLQNVTATFLDTQVNGICWMLGREYGTIPIHPKLADPQTKMVTAQELAAPQLRGGVIVDHVGLGKTWTGIGWLALSAELRLASAASMGQPVYKPSLVLVPSSVVLKQWVDIIRTHFRNLTILVAYGSQVPEYIDGRQWLEKDAIRQGPGPSAHWPKEYDHVFDQADARNERIVIISTYDTWAARTLHDPMPVDADEEATESRPKYECKWAGIFGRVLVDEAHEVRNRATRRWQMLLGLTATCIFFLTATPVINNGQDIVSLVCLIWPMIQKHIPAVSNLPTDSTVEAVRAVAAMDVNTRARYFLNPMMLDRVLRTDDAVYTQAFFREADLLMCIRRSAESILDVGDGTTLSLETIMPPHIVRHIELVHEPMEREEFEWYHRGAVTSYVQSYLGLAQEAKARGRRPQANTPGTATIPGTTTSAGSKHLAAMTAAERRMMAATTSTLLARFEHTANKAKMSTKVKYLESFRRRSVSAACFLDVVHRPSDADLRTGAQRVQFMTYGSPKARFLLAEIRLFGLPPLPGQPATSKLLITEELPVSAWFIELLCSLLHVPCAVIHSGLTEPEKITIVDRFNDPTSDLRVLVTTYGVSMQGVNLYRACWRVLVLCPARSAPLENQATGRAVRVLQSHTVTIIRVIVKDSHDAWIDLRQVNKAVSDLITRALSQSTKQLLVELLNGANHKIRAAHDSADGRKLLAGKPTLSVASGVEKVCGDQITLKKEAEGRTKEEHKAKPGEEAPKEQDDTETTARAKALEDKEQDDTEVTAQGQVPGEKGMGNTEDTTQEKPTTEEPSAPAHRRADSATIRLPVDDDLESEPESYEDTVYDILPLLDFRADANSSAPLAQRKLRRAIFEMAPELQALLTPARMQLLHALSLNPDRVYKLGDLEDSAVLHRALRLLVHHRLGEVDDRFQLTPHVGYRAIPAPIADQIARKLFTDEAKIAEARRVLTVPSSHPGPQPLVSTHPADE